MWKKTEKRKAIRHTWAENIANVALHRLGYITSMENAQIAELRFFLNFGATSRCWDQAYCVQLRACCLRRRCFLFLSVGACQGVIAKSEEGV